MSKITLIAGLLVILAILIMIKWLGGPSPLLPAAPHEISANQKGPPPAPGAPNSPLPVHERARHLELQDLRRLPRLPVGYHGPDTFTLLVNSAGQRPTGRVHDDTTIAVGKGSCRLPASTKVSLIARRGDFYVADVSPPCQTTTTRIREGYVRATDVELAPK